VRFGHFYGCAIIVLEREAFWLKIYAEMDSGCYSGAHKMEEIGARYKPEAQRSLF
jgi:hypothetical protein